MKVIRDFAKCTKEQNKVFDNQICFMQKVWDCEICSVDNKKCDACK